MIGQPIRQLRAAVASVARGLLGDAPEEAGPPLPREVERTFHNDPDAAREAYFHFNGTSPEAAANFDAGLIEQAVAFDYLSWPRKIRTYVRDQDVLDVGCGTGLHAVGYLVVGAKSYTGLDPRVKLDDDKSKNLRRREWMSFGWTPATMMDALPRVRLIAGTFEQVAPEERFDLVVMHNVTEHLMNLEEVIAGARERVRDGGRLLYNHHNFYCWNGHHQKPKFAEEIDPEDPVQRQFYDWAHLDFEPRPDHPIGRSLNRVRLDEIRALTERYFEIERWEERPSNERQGAGRLTPEVRARHPAFSERELTVQNVLCVARPRQAA
jgi:SAM-dependent methyltransferase